VNWRSPWLDWTPGNSEGSGSSVDELTILTKLTIFPPEPNIVSIVSVVSTPAESQSEHDPAAWADDLHDWAMARCVFRERAWGGLTVLHRDYVAWSHQTGNIPPATLPTFKAWATDQGFTLTDGGMVYGLVLGDDLRPGRVLTANEHLTTPRLLSMRRRQ
jgi:hypothetical protein